MSGVGKMHAKCYKSRSFLYFAFRHGTVAKSNKVSGDNSRRPPEVTFFLRQTQVTPFGIMMLFIHFPTPDLGHPLGSIVFSVHFFLPQTQETPSLDLLYFSDIFIHKTQVTPWIYCIFHTFFLHPTKVTPIWQIAATHEMMQRNKIKVPELQSLRQYISNTFSKARK